MKNKYKIEKKEVSSQINQDCISDYILYESFKSKAGKGKDVEESDLWKKVPLNFEKSKILKEAHLKEKDSKAEMHCAIEKMREKILIQGYHWNTIKIDCQLYIRNCETCNKVNPKNKKVGITPLISEFPLERLQMDLMELPAQIKEISKPFIYLLNIVDHFSKIAWSFPLKSKNSEEVLLAVKKNC